MCQIQEEKNHDINLTIRQHDIALLHQRKCEFCAHKPKKVELSLLC